METMNFCFYASVDTNSLDPMVIIFVLRYFLSRAILNLSPVNKKMKSLRNERKKRKATVDSFISNVCGKRTFKYIINMA